MFLVGNGKYIVQSLSHGLNTFNGWICRWAGTHGQRTGSSWLCGDIQSWPFLSIAIVGIVCALLGRMLGDISPLWGIPIGILLGWLGLDMMGIAKCRLPGTALKSFKMRGYTGAFILGSSYDILSGACTFGFIAPILAIITIQQKIFIGVILIILFALGHCLPIIVAGSSVALSQKYVEGKKLQRFSSWGRKIAGLVVIFIGLYFIISPWLS